MAKKKKKKNSSYPKKLKNLQKTRVVINDEDLAGDVIADKNLIQKFKELSPAKKLLFTAPLLILAFGAVSAAVIVFKLDSFVFPSSISGYIKNVGDEGIHQAKICVSNKCTESNAEGFYVIEKLEYGRQNISIKVDGYAEFKDKITLKRGKNTKDFMIRQAGFGEVKGKFVLEGELIEDDFGISLDGEAIESKIIINENKEFQFTNIPAGEYKLQITTPYYVDFETNVEITESAVDIGEVSLKEAGDLKIPVADWLSLEAVEGVSAKADEIEVKSNKEGVIYFKDLATKDNLNIVFSKDGYLVKTIDFAVSPGLQQFESLEFVRTGKVVYVSNRTGNQNVYISNYDGSGEKMLSDNKGNSFDPAISPDGQKVYFLSTREGIKTDYNHPVSLLYSVGTEGGPITKISKTKYEDSNFNIGAYFLEPQKRVYDAGGYYGNTLFLGNIDGTGAKQLLQKSYGHYGSIVIANNSDFVLFGWNDSAGASGVYYVSTKDSNSRMILDGYGHPLDITKDRKKALISKYESQSDLWLVGIFDGSKVRLTSTSVDEFNAVFTPDGKAVSFLSQRDGKRDVYIIGLDGKNERKITDDGKVYNYLWGRDNLIFYISEKVLWVIDPNKPKTARKVTENVLGRDYFYSD